MGKTYKELKSKIAQLRFENSFLTSKVEKVLLENGRVKRELQVSNARIVELVQELELFKNGLLFLNEVREALSDVEKVGEPILEKMVESDVAFSSRFLPSVKFKINGYSQFYAPTTPNAVYGGDRYIVTDFDGFPLLSNDKLFYKAKEVSIYEAIPELVPDGMVYDKESDSLIKKDKR